MTHVYDDNDDGTKTCRRCGLRLPVLQCAPTPCPGVVSHDDEDHDAVERAHPFYTGGE